MHHNKGLMVVKGVLAAILLVVLVGCNQQPKLVVLIPDGALQTDPAIAIWADTAWEEGIKLSFLTDSEFITLGSNALLNYPGIVLPDSTHTRASAPLIAALTSYASAGGWLMIVYDFGALDENGFYPASGPSRLSSLAGINYVLYSTLLDRAVGLGPIAGTSTVLRELQVPPGKSMAIVAAVPASTAITTNTTVGEQALALQVSTTVNTAAAGSGTYLPSSAADPGGLNGYNHAAQFAAVGSESGSVTTTAAKATATLSSLASLQATLAAAAATEVQEQISGYVYGPLTYPTYVTADASGYNGTVLLGSTYGYDVSTSSMTTAGVAAGWRSEGTGGVVFVNTPLTYLNGETDGMLMHGFLRFFAASVLKMPRLSDYPNARGGLVFNWHVDDQEGVDSITPLDTAGVWSKGPFSIHFTAGPDTDVVGDKNGMNVPGNTVAQGWITKFASLNHQIGDHGGWDHNLYGLNATEYNADQLVPGSTNTFVDFLSLNKKAMEAVLGRPVIEYSAPEGNNPIWSLNWLEANGNVGYYFTGHTGLGPTRAYRPLLDTNPPVSQMLNPRMWAFPVSPFGKYATFEEFQQYGVANADIINWYTELVNFVVKNRTSRLIYAHPPGAASYLGVLSSLFSLTDSLSATNQFRWYTMTDLANFEARRLQVIWNEGQLANYRFFGASHPTDLTGFSWLLPKAVYALPAVISGTAEVDQSDSDNWIVTATGGTYLTFYSIRSQ